MTYIHDNATNRNIINTCSCNTTQYHVLCCCGLLQNLLQKHQFMMLRRVAKTLFYKSLFFACGCRCADGGTQGWAMSYAHTHGMRPSATTLQMDAPEGAERELILNMQFFCPMAKVPTATQQMHQVRVVNGKPQFYEPPEVAQARAKLLSAVCRHMPPEPYEGPVSLMVKWCFPVVKGRHRDGEYRITKPDTDNLQKMLKDVMTQCGYWTDDAQVCREIVEKFWAEIPGIFIRVEVLHDTGS